ncbi:MAG: peptidylprolyl isomerase [Deltaproteobacteria bacterium]|nr:MAG: peptidylprolyl isomerase [Deltaproteobacteria bacterium]
MKFSDTKSACFILMIVSIMLTAVAVSAEEKQPAPEKAAVVNGTVITKKDYNRELNQYVGRMASEGRQISEPQLANLKVQILDSLIDRELLYQQSQKEGILVEAQKIEDEIVSIKKRFPSEVEFNIALTNIDLTEATLKLRITQRLAIQKLIDNKIGNSLVVTDKESVDYYTSNPQLFRQPQEVRARHILIKLVPEADEAQKAEAQKKITMIQQKLKNGGDFIELAKEFSEGPSSVSGGDLGFFRRGQMVKPFEEAAFALKANEVSDVVQTRLGYHIIKIVEIKPEGTISYEEIKQRLDEFLKQKKLQEEVALYVNELKKTAKIEKFI